MPAAKVLDALENASVTYKVLKHIDYGTVESPYDFSRLAAIPIENIAKCLLLKSGARYFMAVLPVSAKVDMKVVAQHLDTGRLEVAPLDELPLITGYERFATTAIGLDLPTVLDSTLVNLDKIYIATGTKGEELEISPADLVKVTKAQVADISK